MAIYAAASREDDEFCGLWAALALGSNRLLEMKRNETIRHVAKGEWMKPIKYQE